MKVVLKFPCRGAEHASSLPGAFGAVSMLPVLAGSEKSLYVSLLLQGALKGWNGIWWISWGFTEKSNPPPQKKKLINLIIAHT